VHETLSKTAALIAGYDATSDKAFIDGLMKGSYYPDVPEERWWDGGLVGLWYYCDGDPACLTARSHEGDLSYWHSMAVPGVTKPQVMQKLMVNWICKQYSIALAATDPKTRGEQIGRALHTLQDSYCLSHTTREFWMEMELGQDGRYHLVQGFGRITRFQDYSKQDHAKHREQDMMPDLNGSGDHNIAGKCAVDASAQILMALRDSTSVAKVRQWLVEGPLALAKDCQVGGTDPAYAP
jgi:hypothetical protein